MNNLGTLLEQVLKAYEKVPDCYLILSPELVILTASDSYLEATHTQRVALMGKYIFDAFPMTSSAANGPDALLASLQQVLKTKKPHHLHRHRYDLVHSKEGQGERYWHISNTPIEEEGTILYLIQKVEDITKQVTTEQRLASNEALLRATEAAANVGSYEVNLTTNQFRFSDGMYRLFGEEPGSLVPSLEWIDSRSHPDDIIPVRQVLEEAAANNKPYYYTRRIYRKDRELRLLEAHGKVIVDAAGHAIKFIGLVQDITERTKAELAFKQKQELQQATLNSLPDMIQVFEAVRDDRGNIIDFIWVLNNHESEKAYGDAIGKSLLQLQPGVVKEGIFDAFKAVTETGMPQQYEKYYVHEQFNGWFHQSVVKLQDGVATITSNITQRKEAEEQIKTTKESLQATLDSSLYFIQAFKAVRDETGKIIDFTWIFTNHVWNEQFGDVTGKSLLQQNPAVVETGLFTQFVQVTETGVALDYEHYYSHEQFHQQWFHQIVVKMDDGFVINTEDITSRKKIEQELQQSKNLLQHVIDAPNIGMAVYKALRNDKGEIMDFVHEYINRASVEMLGDDFTGKLFTDHGANGRLQLPQLIEVIETGQRNSYLREADFRGRKVWFAITNTPLDADRLVHTWEDVTERKKAEVEILHLKEEIAQKATDKYKTIFNAVDDGFCVIELLHHENGRAVDFIYHDTNPSFVRQTGLQMEGRKRSEFFTHIEPSILNTYDRVAKTGETAQQEYQVKELDNRWFQTRASRVGGEGSNQVAVIFRDITERKEREQQQEFLLEFSDALRTELNADAVANRALQMLVEQLRLDRCYIAVYRQEAGHVDFTHQVGNDRVPPLPEGGIHLSNFPEAFRVVSDRTLLIDDFEEIEGLSDTDRRNINALGLRALVAAILRRSEHMPNFVIVAASATLRQWTKGEIALIEEVTERTWLAMERARAGEALRESEERLQSIANLVPDLLWESESDGSTYWYNQRWLEYTGQSLEEAIDRGWVDAIHPDDYEASTRRYHETVENGEVLHQEHRIRRYDGEYRWFVVNVFMLRDESGQPIKVYGAATDIHELHLMNEALRESETRFRSFVLASSDSVYRMSADWQVIYNLEGKTFLANTSIANNSWLNNYIPDHEQLRVSKAIEEAIKNKSIFELEHHILDANKNLSWALSRAVPILDEKGEIVEWLGAASDITPRKKAEEALRESKERMQKALSIETVGVLYFDLEGGIDDCNVAFERMSGYSRQNFVSGRVHWTKLIPPEFMEAALYSREELLTQGQYTPYEKQYLRPDGTRWWGLCAGKRLSENEYVEFILDITELKEAEEKLQQFNELLEQQVQERTSELIKTTEELQKNLAKLQRAEEVAQMGSWEYDIASGEMSWSAGMYRLFGLPAGSPVQPETYLEYVIEEDRPIAEKLVDVIRHHPQPIEETLRLRVDGQILTCRIKAVVQRNEQGSPTKILGIDLDISAVKRLEEENLQIRLNQQKALLLAILEAQEEERRRISESLHNGVGQMLYATKLNLEQATHSLPLVPLEKANKLLDAAIQETRRVSHELVPIVLRDFGLTKAVEEMCEKFANSLIRVKCEIEIESRLEPYLELAIYRISQELLNNVIKHAHASKANLLLVQENEKVILRVRDNGQGIPVEPGIIKGIGLRSIADRIKLLNGTFIMNTPPSGKGTMVTIRIPIPGK
ncbi:PAS domain S-box protein [Adhaeribacter aquaticus]|uniref:PAS domain S-box protein n=1 Tax=Adhaeribacter aquaticus TaxID=299567 RepID=UPI0004257D7A|nr:PAS domain S-box protein [Adhaeribacter aquaticus]